MKHRTPLKQRPLRQPGQSLREEQDRIFEDEFLPWALAAASTFAFALYEWVRYWWSLPLQPWVLTALAAVAFAGLGWKIYRLRPRMRALRLGLEGEKAVGQFLERLHADGYQVFHDVQGVGFNVDHVLVGPAGVFTIETKTWNKPFSDARVSFDGRQIRIGGKSPERDVLRQARAQAAWLRAQVLERTGSEYGVHPVVLFPGWYVEAPPSAFEIAWVLEPKALPTFLVNAPRTLSTEQANFICAQLSRMIREDEDRRNA